VKDLRERTDPTDVKEALQYGIPVASNYPAADAIIIIRPDIVLQMSVSAHHGYSVPGLKKIRDGLKLTSSEPLRLVLVCPPTILPLVQWQKFYHGNKEIKNPRLKVDQYVMAVDWNLQASTGQPSLKKQKLEL